MNIIKHALALTFVLATAIPVFAQQDDADVMAFEKENAGFIAEEMPDSELVVCDAAMQSPTYDVVSHTQMLEDEIANEDTLYSGWVAKVVRWYGHNVTYGAVCGLMTLESSFIPFPSEIVIPPAAMVAADPGTDNDMKIWLIVLVGTLGALIGAYINYFLSRWLGRPIIYKFVDSKWGHALSLSGEKMERAEQYFNDHGVVSTFVGRLIPVIRQLISIPAGLSKMNIATFTLFTFLGALIWNCVLGLLGYLAVGLGGMTFIYKNSKLLSKIIIVLFGVACVWLIVRAMVRKRRKEVR